MTVALLPAQRELLASVAEATRERLTAAACSIAVLDGTELEFLTAAGAGADRIVGRRIPAGHGIAGFVVASGQTIAIADVERDARFARATAESTGYVPRAILAAPVDGDDGAVGVLEVLDRAPGPHDLTVAATAARQGALVLAQAAATAGMAALLADPAGASLLALAGELAAAGPAPTRLAERVLAAVAEHTRDQRR